MGATHATPTLDATQRHAALVAANLRDMRRAAGLTQQQLADQAGVERIRVNEWERARHAPSAAHLDALADALGCDWTSFFARRND